MNWSTQIAWAIVTYYRGPHNDGSERILLFEDAIAYALASLPFLDCLVQDDGKVILFLHLPFFKRNKEK